MNTNNEYVNQLINDIANAQQKRYAEKQAYMLEAYPWLKGVRDAQKKFNEKKVGNN